MRRVTIRKPLSYWVIVPREISSIPFLALAEILMSGLLTTRTAGSLNMGHEDISTYASPYRTVTPYL
jgi:hypothetical protein